MHDGIIQRRHPRTSRRAFVCRAFGLMKDGSLLPRAGIDAALVSRRRQMPLRLGFASVMAGALGVFTGVSIALQWLCIYVVLQLVEALYLPALKPSRALRAGPAILGLNALAFGSLSWLAVLSGDPFALAGAAFCLTGAMLNGVVNTFRSRAAFWATQTPYIIYSLGLPAFALSMGANLQQIAPLAVSALLIPLLCWTTGRSLRCAMQDKDAALILAEERRREADRATEAKSRFVALVSHELRTPLAAIVGGAEALKKDLQGAQKDNADLLVRAGALMTGILNDLLDLSKVEAGRLSVDVTDFDLRTLLHQTHALWSAHARRKGLRLRLQGTRSVPRWIRGDPVRVQQILNNLLSNAVKFTSEGAITLDFEVFDDSAGGSLFRIGVVDTGPGMSPAELERLFKPYQQANADISRRFGGTGLGLSISRDLARLMGGEVTVEAAPGAGSRFTLSLPLQSAEPGLPAPAEDNVAEGLHGLVADDHPIGRQAMTVVMEAAGLRVSVASSGNEALARALSEPYDLIFIDVNMPGLSGIQVTETIRNSRGPNQSIPIFAVTGAVDPETVSLCLDAGVTEVLAKPIEARAVILAVAKQMAPSRNGGVDPADQAAEPTSDDATCRRWTALNHETLPIES